MATYSKLLLSTGGGIISQIQQAEQVEHTATLLIGLGGTGIDCLTEIKKAVRERLQPDNPDALVPTYNHIRFLAVDTDVTSGITGFDKNETFDIANPNVKKALKSKSALDTRRELDWLDPEKVDVADIGDAGAGGFRQAGRYMMMDKSNQFLAKIKEMITLAKKDAGKASLYIHIFAGISGGTGSGTFLDVCYLVRKAISEANGGDGVVLGYFFLPDVNLDRIPTSASLVQSYVPKNGYAAMQELDYCMRLPENGGSFTQVYKNGTQIDWNEPPVDLCHLISATDKSFQVVNNAYNNSMKVTAEYVMDFLTKPDEGTHADATEVGVVEAESGEGESKFSIKSHLANFTAMVNAADGGKSYGYNLRYLVIGASCASIPMRKINTYLASKVFERFASLSSNTPSEVEVQELANKAKIVNVDSLLTEITKNGGDSNLIIAPDVLGMEFTRDNGDKDLLYHYTDQKAEKMGVIEKNAQSMMDEKNSDSLIGRVCAQLDACAMDLSRGPAYAYRVVQASFAGNILNIIDGVIENVDKRRSQRNHNVYEQAGSYKDLYEESRQFWYGEKNKRKKLANKAFDQYVVDMEQYIIGQIEVTQLEQLLTVMKKLREQVARKADEYYLKFSRVMDNLISTFKENRDALNNDPDGDDKGTFAIPLLTIREIRPTLDSAVEKMDMSGVLSQFVAYMFRQDLDGKPVWIDEDDDKISRAVKDFFIHNVFAGFASRTITEFLSDKYGTTNAAVITNNLYKDYMLKLKDRSEALFPIDPGIYGGDDNEIAYVSVPTTADVVINAAEQLHAQYDAFKIKKSALKDRIYIMRCSVALPIGAYSNGELYETSYYSDYQCGRHYYVGKGGCELFNDWHQLLPLRPQSLIDNRDKLPERLQTILQEACDVYDQAKEANLFDGNMIRKVSDGSMTALDEAMAYVAAAETRVQAMPGNAAVIYQDAAQKLKAALDGIQYESSGYNLPAGSAVTADVAERIRKDYFVISPALHTVVRREMERLAKYRAKYEELTGKVAGTNKELTELKEFAKALFTGAIAWDMAFGLTYNKMEFGIPMPQTLTDFTQQDKYKYAMLPLYQAFLSYQALDEADRKNISADANQRFAGMAALPEVVSCVKACEAKINMEFVNGFMTVAATYPEINEAARKFIGTLMQELAATVATVKAFGVY